MTVTPGHDDHTTDTPGLTVVHPGRTAAHHERLAEDLLDLSQQHMRKRDEATHRRGPWARRRERRHFANASWIATVAQVHATLAGAKRDD